MRIAFHIALVISILFTPWWTGAIILVAACLIVDRFYEAVLYGVIVDAIYSTTFGYHGFAYAATLYAVSVYLLVSLVRSRLAW
jgi:cell shape-determining protein MreD